MITYGDSFKEVGIDLADYYLNPNQLQDMTKRLHVCETLFGDLNARVLVLLQDAADVDTLLSRASSYPDKQVLRHGEDILTNKRLVDWFKDYFPISIEGDRADDCGLYYANSIWLLKRTGGMSGAIQKKKKTVDACKPVLLATLRNLEKVELLCVFGVQAHSAICDAFGINTSWKNAKENVYPDTVDFEGRQLKVVALNHPAARIPPESTKRRLHTLLDQLGFSKKI